MFAMSASYSTFDIALGGEPMILFQTTTIKDELTLCEKLGVWLSNGGGVISLGSTPRTETERFPSGLLISNETDTPVGMVSQDFNDSGQFGILEDKGKYIARAEAIGDSYDRVTYDDSMQKLG